MNSHSRSAVLSRAQSATDRDFYRLAIVGAATLKGKEVSEVINERNFPSADIKLLDDDETLGQLEAAGNEITFIQSVRAEQFENIDFTFFASDARCTRANWKLAQKAGSAIIDLSYELENEPDAAIRSPWVERQLGQSPGMELQPGPAVVPHPAAIVLALLQLRVTRLTPLVKAVATVFEPASEHGQKGMDELHEQTVNLLSFQAMPRKVFDAQVAFNLVSRYGEQSVPSLAAIEGRVRSHYQKLAGSTAITPSLFLVQAPVFHGHTFAIHLEAERAIGLDELRQALAGEHVHVASEDADSPSTVSPAGQGDIQVSVRIDGARPNSFWLWAASDNLRIAAATAVECAESMTASRPRGKVQ